MRVDWMADGWNEAGVVYAVAALLVLLGLIWITVAVRRRVQKNSSLPFAAFDTTARSGDAS